MPYSTFSKIRDILTEVDQGGEATVGELAERIRSSWPDKAGSFTWFRRAGGEPPSEIEPCSLDSIRRNIRFAERLGLLSSQDGVYRLTDDGRNAVRGDYAGQVGTLVNGILADRGFSLRQVNLVISQLPGGEVPDWQTIWKHRPRECLLEQEEFRKLLYLSGRSGNIDLGMRLVYGVPGR